MGQSGDCGGLGVQRIHMHDDVAFGLRSGTWIAGEQSAAPGRIIQCTAELETLDQHGTCLTRTE